jgi:hypothetical protein
LLLAWQAALVKVPGAEQVVAGHHMVRGSLFHQR